MCIFQKFGNYLYIILYLAATHLVTLSDNTTLFYPFNILATEVKK
jgi:hypothetical protein